MYKNSLLKAALLGNASALGLNWIYDKDLLLNLSKTEKMIFRNIDHDLYKKAKKSYDVYPNHKNGQLDFMGEVLYLFHMFFDYEKEINIANWRENFYQYFRYDYEYDGYIESYGKDFLTRYKNELDNITEPQNVTDHIDKQLVGLTFILHLYECGRSIDKINDSITYAKTLTGYKNIEPLTKMLFELLRLLDKGNDKTEVLKEVIKLAPPIYQDSLNNAITYNDTYKFIEDCAGVACGIDQALPLIFHIIKKSASWEDGLILNATLGGNSTARGLFIGGILSRIYEIPDKYNDKLYYNI